jgi:hypothetical protein
MRFVSRYALVAVTCIPLSALIHVVWPLGLDRIALTFLGSDAVFYGSALESLALGLILTVGILFGIAGVVSGPRVSHRFQSVFAGLMCFACFGLIR